MKTMGKIKLLTLLTFLGAFVAIAQTTGEFEEWKKKEQETFQKFKDARDREFADFLKKEWQEFEACQGIVRDETPKPMKMPVYVPPVDTLKLPTPPPRIVKDIPVPLPTPELKLEPEKKPVLVEREGINTLELTFFDAPLSVDYDVRFKAASGNQVSKESISAFWGTLSRSNYENCLVQAEYYKKQMRLNDWGYCQLLDKIGEGIYNGSQNQRCLFVWFMLSKSGYEAKVGYSKDQLYLMLPSENVLYGASYFTFGGRRFYVVSFDGRAGAVGSLFTYDGKYPGADRPISLKVDRPPSIKEETVSKVFKFQYGGKEYTVPVKFNKNTVDFFERYPQTDFEVYFDASPSPEADLALVSALKPILEGKSEAEAVNILLRFVQTAFGYRVDDEQFGREKSLFADETLFYPFSDCEDRAILFAYLVRRLIGLEIIGLDYPGHVATAVKFSSEVKGDYVRYQNKNFMICDPTYIDADFGMPMPKFKGITPKVIPIRV